MGQRVRAIARRRRRAATCEFLRVPGLIATCDARRAYGMRRRLCEGCLSLGRAAVLSREGAASRDAGAARAPSPPRTAAGSASSRRASDEPGRATSLANVRWQQSPRRALLLGARVHDGLALPSRCTSRHCTRCVSARPTRFPSSMATKREREREQPRRAQPRTPAASSAGPTAARRGTRSKGRREHGEQARHQPHDRVPRQPAAAPSVLKGINVARVGRISDERRKLATCPVVRASRRRRRARQRHPPRCPLQQQRGPRARGSRAAAIIARKHAPADRALSARPKRPADALRPAATMKRVFCYGALSLANRRQRASVFL